MTTVNTSRSIPDRTDLPFVDLATFAGQPACPDWDRLDGADVAVLGVPIATASSHRVGARFGPRAMVTGQPGRNQLFQHVQHAT
jgi:agmatinase